MSTTLAVTFSEWLAGGHPAALGLEFLAGCVVVFVAGRYLTRSADAIGERLRWGEAWVGLLMLATITFVWS